MRIKKSLIFPLLFSLLWLAACSFVQSAGSASLEGSQWDLAGFGPSASITQPVQDTHPTLDFSGNEAQGSTGCNNFGTNYTLNGDKIQFSAEGFMTTLMYCDPPEIMDQETRYLSFLQKAATYTLDNDQLILHTPDGDLIFHPAQHLPLEGTDWQLGGIAVGEVIVSTAVDENINIRFENGQASGISACNHYGGDYAIDGEKLTLGVLFQTEMACAEEIDQRESTYLSVLGEVAGYRIERNTLTLLDSDRNMLMSFTGSN